MKNRVTKNACGCGESGVTLLEMIVVVALISLMIGITFPAVGAGLESVRLREGADDVVTSFNAALIRSERFQEAVEITISSARHAVETVSLVSGAKRRVDLPDGVNVVRVLPSDQVGDNSEAPESTDRKFILYPNGSVPRISIDLANRRGKHRLVSLDPITGVARQTAFSGSLDQQSAGGLLNQGESALGAVQ